MNLLHVRHGQLALAIQLRLALTAANNRDDLTAALNVNSALDSVVSRLSRAERRMFVDFSVGEMRREAA